MELDCPLCHAPLDVKGSSAHCAQCERVFTLEAAARNATSRWRC
ncbi:Protein of uncharacterised function (DUF1407) [Serratia liquefaciens]|nr:Protein of uncharacterised function (DUF1407) [Serratia liquefaciens]